MVKFLLFSDFHYDKNRYPLTVGDLEKVLKRGYDEKVDFVLQCGDFCVDAVRSPEIFKALLQNKYNLPVYGVCGNHDLEIMGNSMEFLVPLLTNSKVEKPFPDASYYYVDIKGIRLICLDTNFSFDPVAKVWEHTLPGHTMGKAGNTNLACLCPEEFDWLKNTLDDAKEKGLKAILVSHHALSGCFNFNCGCAPEIKELLENYINTAVMCINGDLHAEYFAFINYVAYYSITSTRYLDANTKMETAYPDSLTYEYTDYDMQGNIIGKYQKPFNSLQQKHKYYTEEPMSAIVTINDDGVVNIKGCSVNWVAGITPSNRDLQHPHYPYITDRDFKLYY